MIMIIMIVIVNNMFSQLFQLFFFTLTLILLNIPSQCLLTMTPYSLISQNIKPPRLGLTNFSINSINFSGTNKILIFGGTYSNSNNTATNQIFQTHLTNTSTTVYNIMGNKPQARSNHCTYVYQYKLYVYGGNNTNNQTLTDLWEFNSIFLSWSYISTSNMPITSCNIIKNDTNLIIMGVHNYSTLQILKYSLLNNQWSVLSYQYASNRIVYGKNWLNQTIQTKLSIQIQPSQISAQILQSSTLQYKYIYQIMIFSVQQINSTNYLIITDCAILDFSVVSLKVTWIRNFKFSTYRFRTVITADWLFIVKQYNQTIVKIENYYIRDFSISGVHQYSKDSIESNLEVFMYNQDIYVLFGSTLNSYLIEKNCTAHLNMANVDFCFYNKVFCKDGYMGDNCSIPVCSNTLILLDSSSYTQITYSCSGHGTCTLNGCQCDQYWSGPDCSTYTRQHCLSDLVQNWPVMNCQCANQTSGGNSCQVTFCYNDCTGHGMCQSTGDCVCDTGFYGQDFSQCLIQYLIIVQKM